MKSVNFFAAVAPELNSTKILSNEIHPRRGSRWTDEEDALLARLFDRGMCDAAIVAEHMPWRTMSSVSERRQRLGLLRGRGDRIDPYHREQRLKMTEEQRAERERKLADERARRKEMTLKKRLGLHGDVAARSSVGVRLDDDEDILLEAHQAFLRDLAKHHRYGCCELNIPTTNPRNANITTSLRGRSMTGSQF